jgi:hypothetical protein
LDVEVAQAIAAMIASIPDAIMSTAPMVKFIFHPPYESLSVSGNPESPASAGVLNKENLSGKPLSVKNFSSSPNPSRPLPSRAGKGHKAGD